MPKSFITEGVGFIEAHVVDDQIELGRQIVRFDALSGGFHGNGKLSWLLILKLRGIFHPDALKIDA